MRLPSRLHRLKICKVVVRWPFPGCGPGDDSNLTAQTPFDTNPQPNQQLTPRWLDSRAPLSERLCNTPLARANRRNAQKTSLEAKPPSPKTARQHGLSGEFSIRRRAGATWKERSIQKHPRGLGQGVRGENVGRRTSSHPKGIPEGEKPKAGCHGWPVSRRGGPDQRRSIELGTKHQGRPELAAGAPPGNSRAPETPHNEILPEGERGAHALLGALSPILPAHGRRAPITILNGRGVTLAC